MPSNPETMSSLLVTPLNAAHRTLGARLVDFAGWEMPVQYPSGILAEHAAVREAAGLFDLSHMGRIYLQGRDALALAQECCTRDLARLQDGEAAYSVLCQDDGGIVDDIIVYLLGPEDVLAVFNASNRLVDLELFQTTRDRLGFQVDLEDRTLETALIGLQGPRAQAIVNSLASRDLDALSAYAFVREVTVAGAPSLVARTGYTGEDGFELLVEAAHAERVWQALLDAGAAPAGLGARDTLRTEAGFALYGHEIDRSTQPFEARLGWVVDLNKPSFNGREALARLKAAGPARRLVGLKPAPGGIPRQGATICDDAGPQIGSVTSGTFSPTLRENIALGYVPVERSRPGQTVAIDVRGRRFSADVVKLPFVPHHTRTRAPS